MFILKPCPFCGARGTDVITMKDEMYLYELQPCKVLYIQCAKCGGRAGYAASEKEARKNWNKRAK